MEGARLAGKGAVYAAKGLVFSINGMAPEIPCIVTGTGTMRTPNGGFHPRCRIRLFPNKEMKRRKYSNLK